MTTFLSSIILTAGADKMAVSDPHGLTLTLVSVAVVFSALIILYFIYSLSGGIVSGKIRLKKSSPDDGEAVATAIAMALEQEACSAEAEAAIAMALHLYLSGEVHDLEPGIITIKRKDNTNWKFSNARS